MSKSKTLLIILAISFISFFAALTSVSAQYNTEIIEPNLEGNEEVYGIDIATSDKVVLYPRNCGAILSVTIEASNKIDGDIIINSVEKAPKDEKLSNVYEVCEIKLRNINVDDFEVVEVDFKVTKSWMDDNDVESKSINFYSYNDNKSNWDKEDTNKKSENSIYQYYNADVSNMTYWAIATKSSSNPLDNIGSNLNMGTIIGACLCVLLILIMLITAIAIKKNKEKQEKVKVAFNN